LLAPSVDGPSRTTNAVTKAAATVAASAATSATPVATALAMNEAGPLSCGKLEARRNQRAYRKRQAAKRAVNFTSSDRDDEEAEGEDDEMAPLTVETMVKSSLIPTAGDGLFLASRFAKAGTVLLDEEAVAIRRPAAKKIQNTPQWKGLQPVIQGSGDRFLDIRLLRLYKANHTEATSTKCNAYVVQSGPARLVMIARRDIWRGEEILWEYSATLLEFRDG